jgi:hypothetical protein
MPTVFRFGRFRAVIYPNDHRPEHVHVIGPDREAVFFLNCPTGPVAIRQNFGFTNAEARRVAARLNTVVQHL